MCAVSFEDVVNPTSAELRRWAMSGDKLPIQDWDLCLADEANADLLMDLIVEGYQDRFFLGCLYLLSGDAVRTGFRTVSSERLTELDQAASRRGHPYLTTWRTRTESLLSNPERFYYDDWCGGGLARRPIEDG